MADQTEDSLPQDGGAPQGGENESQSQLPPELQGKSAEEIYTTLSQVHNQEVQTAVAQAQSGVADQIKTLTEKLDAVSQQQQAAPSPGAASPAPARPQPGPGFVGPDDEPSYLSDPDQFVGKALDKRMAPMYQAYTSNQRETNKQFFTQQNPEEYTKYGEEIEQFMDQLSPVLQANPKSYTMASNYVKSLHLDEITEARGSAMATEKLKGMLENLDLSEERVSQLLGKGNGQPVEEKKPASLFQPVIGIPRTERATQTGSSPGRLPNKPSLTPEQKQMAKNFGMSEKEYAEYATENTDIVSQIQGGQG